ncbi:helix-turn-helix transcriptional regulator [Sodalis sp. TME1]|nr:helix-turn-helix transcriptional regulator [Sodalis sp. TME1]
MNDILMYTCLHLNTPCAVTGESDVPFFNPAMQTLLNSTMTIELFLKQEEKACGSGQFFSAQNRWSFGPEQTLQSYLFDFYPQFDCVENQLEDAEFECIGTICHARPFPFGSTLECVDGEAPRPATFEPGERFTPSEQQIVFFSLHNLTSKETGRRLGISHRTVENKLQDIYQKTETHCNRGLAMYCRENGTDRYIPPSLLSPSSHVLNTVGSA